MVFDKTSGILHSPRFVGYRKDSDDEDLKCREGFKGAQPPPRLTQKGPPPRIFAELTPGIMARKAAHLGNAEFYGFRPNQRNSAFPTICGGRKDSDDEALIQ